MDRTASLRLLGVALFVVALAAGCGGGSPGNPTPGVTTQQRSALQQPALQSVADEIATDAVRFNAPLVPPRGKIYLGAYVAPVPDESPQAQITATAEFESKIGRPLAIDLHYHIWSDTLAGIGEQDDAAKGRIPLVSWSCVDANMTGVKDADIAAGLYDAAIARRAAAIAAFGKPIFIRYKWEMNLLHNPLCADPAHDIVDKFGKPHYSPPEFIAAWKHIRSIFAANNATNAVWVWNPSGNGITPNEYYPGDSEVDWVGFDWYDTFNLYFDTIYNYSYDKKTGRRTWTYPYLESTYPNKPMMISETGAEQNWQPNYFDGNCCNYSAVQALHNALTHVQAYVYWDSTGGRGNYQLLQVGLPSFKRFAATKYMSASPQP